MFEQTSKYVALAADKLTLQECLALGRAIGDKIECIKIHVLWDLVGPSLVKMLKDSGYKKVWVDLKLHDIPETVALRAAAVQMAGADLVTVQASGGVPMMRAAVKTGIDVLAVTVLTSLEPAEAYRIYGRGPRDKVLEFAYDAELAGCAGIVCSPEEVGDLSLSGKLSSLQLTTPGIRSAGVDKNDQQRVSTPKQAIMRGSKRLVVGRQLTEAKDLNAALIRLDSEIAEAISMMG